LCNAAGNKSENQNLQILKQKLPTKETVARKTISGGIVHAGLAVSIMKDENRGQ